MLKSEKRIPLAIGAIILLVNLLGSVAGLAADNPVVSNVTASQRDGTFLVDVTFDLEARENHSCWINLYCSLDGGLTWPFLCRTVTGAVGPWIEPGQRLSVVWDAEADIPGHLVESCLVRVVANDGNPLVAIDSLWITDLEGTEIRSFSQTDTIPFGTAFGLRWQGKAPATDGMPPLVMASLDTVPPFDDGLLGYKYRFLAEPCIDLLEDCWQPRAFHPATGDSFSYFTTIEHLTFANDASGPGWFERLLPSGPMPLRLNAVDLFGQEIREYLQEVTLVINHDPETIILNGETDWAHPEDPETYPYYIMLDDPLQEHHPFVSGDRIPDFTYVVVKALGKDHGQDLKIDPGYGVKFTGVLRGTRDNITGGLFSFETEEAELRTPTWGPGVLGWSADTLGFLTGPRMEFEIRMMAVDEHDRRDGTPPALSFDVGYPPCVQCVEILPKITDSSAHDPDLECVTQGSAHPCFQDTTEVRVTMDGLGPQDLEYVSEAYLRVDKTTGITTVTEDNIFRNDGEYIIDARLYRMSVILAGQDDPREIQAEPIRRIGGWRYQVDYGCDPGNAIPDGPGPDDIEDFLWGIAYGQENLELDPATGLWRLGVDVVIPTHLMILGSEYYRDIALPFSYGVTPEDLDLVFEATTRQTGTGSIKAVALDQTQCGLMPVRPARFHPFRGVRPTVSELPPGMTWRDCNLRYWAPGIMFEMDLSRSAMESLEGQPVTKAFRIIVETDTGDFSCP